jgi:hypothetical protein
MGLHKNILGDSIHVSHAYTYASASARTAATGFIVTDIGKVAFQSDTKSFWILTNNSPVTWAELTQTTANVPGNIITVGKSGPVDFNSIASAIALATTRIVSGQQQCVVVYPGIYTEFPFTVLQGISLLSATGTNDAVSIVAADSTNDLITLQGGNIIGFTLSGVRDAAKALIRSTPHVTIRGASGLGTLSLTNCSNGIIVEGGTTVVAVSVVVRCLTPNASVDLGILVTGSGVPGPSTLFMTTFGLRTVPQMLPFYPGRDPLTMGMRVTSGGVAEISGGLVKLDYNTVNQIAFSADGTGSSLRIQGVSFDSGNIAVKIPSGSAVVNIQGSVIENHNYNFVVDSSTGSIFAQIGTDSIKQTVVPGGNITGIMSTTIDRSTALSGNVKYTYPSARSAVIGDFIYDIGSSGLTSGGTTSVAGLDVTVASGEGWVKRLTEEDLMKVSWTGTTVTLTPNATNYIFYDGGTLAITSNTTGTTSSSITIAIAYTDASNVRFIHNTTVRLDDPRAKLQTYLSATRKFTYANGLSCSEGSTSTKITVSAGTYFVSGTAITLVDHIDAAFSYFYDQVGGYVEVVSTDLDTANYDFAGVLTAMTPGYYRSDTVYVTSDNRISIIYGTEEFALQADALEASIASAPPFIAPSGFVVAKIVVQEGVGIDSIVDIRSTYNSGASASGGGGGGGVTDHGLLSGLGSDDHTQYLLGDGSRAMSGDLDMGAHNIVNIDLVNGVDVDAHASRHNPGQIDAIATATPVAVLVGASAAEGVASSVARSDHQHGIATATPVSVGTSNSAGSASTVSRSDHVHSHGNQTSGTHHALVIADPGGTAGFMSAADKQKLDTVATSATNTPLTNTAPVDVTPTAASVGVSTEAARQDHKHSIGVASAGTISIGDISAAGSSASLSRSDHTHALPAPAAPANITKSAASAGVATTVARSDHKHDVTTSIAGSITIGASAAEGTATSLSRSDHAHALAAPSAPVNVTKSTADAGVSTAPARADHKHDVTTAAPTTISVITADEGTATSLSRSDHIHGVSTAVPGTIQIGASADEGSATSLSRSDHTHALTAPSAPSDVTKAAASAGVSNNVARADHKHDITTAIVGGITIGAVAAEGVATSLARSDHTHSLPSPSAPANITKSTADAGVSITAARSDHKHDITTASAAAITIGASSTEGTATSLARSDHTHALSAPAAPANVTKATADAGVSTSPARADHKHDVTTAVAGSITVGAVAAEGVATSLARSDHTHALTAPSAPADITKSAASAGVATTVARSDHKHDVTTGTPVNLGTANSEGVATTLARSDHVHKAALQQTSFAEITSDTTTTSLTYVDLLSVTITTIAGNISIYASASGDNTNNARLSKYRIMIDGVADRGFVANVSPSLPDSGAIVLRRAVTAGSHTIKLQWATSANTARIRPITNPDTDHASLLVEEVTV